jgi:hypothetical protein
VKPGFNICQACTKHAPEDTFTYTAEGQKLCRGCHAEYLSQKATKTVRREEEFRRCPICGKVMTPTVIMSTDSPNNESTLPTVQARRYNCPCGYQITIKSQIAFVLFALFAGVAAFATGRAWHTGDPEQLVVGAIAVLVTGPILLWEVQKRWRNPRVR